MGTTKLYIGTCDKDSKIEMSIKKAKRLVYDVLFNHGYENFTYSECYGVYRHKDGITVNEKTIVITICSDDNLLNLHLVVDDLKKELNQECIMIEKYASLVRFI